MGSSDSTCCGTQKSSIPTRNVDADATLCSVRRTRKMHDNRQTHPSKQGTQRLITALILYQDRASANTALSDEQYDALMQCFIEQMKDNHVQQQTARNAHPPSNNVVIPLYQRSDVSSATHGHVTHTEQKQEAENHNELATDSENESTPPRHVEEAKYGQAQPPSLKKQKSKYARIATQIEILHSDGLRAQSLLLCVKPEYIRSRNGSNEGLPKKFGFLPFLKTNITEDAAEELFNKFPHSAALTTSQFVALLTLTVIIYKIKVYQLRTGAVDKPKDIDSQKVQQSIEHLAIWCIRKYGKKMKRAEHISIVNDVGQQINGSFNRFKLDFTKHDYLHCLERWVQEYVDSDGYL